MSVSHLRHWGTEQSRDKYLPCRLPLHIKAADLQIVEAVDLAVAEVAVEAGFKEAGVEEAEVEVALDPIAEVEDTKYTITS